MTMIVDKTVKTKTSRRTLKVIWVRKFPINSQHQQISTCTIADSELNCGAQLNLRCRVGWKVFGLKASTSSSQYVVNFVNLLRIIARGSINEQVSLTSLNRRVKRRNFLQIKICALIHSASRQLIFTRWERSWVSGTHRHQGIYMKRKFSKHRLQEREEKNAVRPTWLLFTISFYARV